MHAGFERSIPDRRSRREICGQFLGIGYSDRKLIECYDLMSAIATGNLLLPNFRDGCKITRIVEAIVKSAKSREWQEVSG